MPTCDLCGEECPTAGSLGAHKRWNHADDLPHHDPDTLRDRYHGQGMTTQEMADEFGCSERAVRYQMEKHDIERRDRADTLRDRYQGVTFDMDVAGYERARCQHRAETDEVKLHRLTAVAWFGWDAVVENVVHHLNNIPWDTREDNIELMAQSDHIKIHVSRAQGLHDSA